MIHRPVTAEQIRAYVESLSADSPHPVALIAATPSWAEGDVDCSRGPVRVVPASSPLAVREAVVSARGGAGFTVVLTDVGEADLGLDVMARVHGHKVRTLDPWAIVRARLRVNGIDPLMKHDQWMADALVQYEPAGGWQVVPSGYLQVEDAWQRLRDDWLRLGDGRSLTDLVRWLSTPGRVHALLDAPESIRVGATARLADDHGPLTEMLIGLAMAGRSGDVLPLGLAAQVVFGGSEGADMAYSRARFDTAAGVVRLDAALGRVWAAAAESVATEVLRGDGRAAIDVVLERAEAFVTEFGAADAVAASSVLPSALEARYTAASAAAVSVAGSAGEPELLADLLKAVESVRVHSLASAEPGRLASMHAAMRLAVRAAQPEVDPPATLPDWATRYCNDLAWVDRARQALRLGDRNPVVAEAYTSLLEAVDSHREEANRLFAQQLVQWSAGEPGEHAAIVPIEDVLGAVVAPIAGSAPVLLVVLDGMSWAVATELVDSMSALGWSALQPDGGRVPCAIAITPSVTSASRCSLLSGSRLSGLAEVEKKAFPAAPALAAVRAGAAVFHKADLLTPDGAALAPGVSQAIADDSRRVVAVVVNAIDDHLAHGQQSNRPWGVEDVRPLQHLLSAAASGGRVVVLTSDHGHVVDDKRTTYRHHTDGGERWRLLSGAVEDGEVVISGPRVLRGEGTVVMPWSETIRYANPKQGYHGGATPQEMLVPVLVMARATTELSGWHVGGVRPPVWWDVARLVNEATVVGDVPPVAPAVVAPVRAPKPASAGQEVLFDAVVEPAVAPAEPSRGAADASGGDADGVSVLPEWVTAVLSSTTYAGRRAIANRLQLDDALVGSVVASLERRGGSALLATLAADAGVPEFRAAGLVSGLMRLFNIDGYGVIDRDGDTVTLNRVLLLTQFGVTS